MSEVLDGRIEAETAGSDITAGALLRRAREAAGLHVAALAVSLKVPVRKLEALEEDRYDLMSDAVFVRGLAGSVCRTLKIDPQPVLERLPQSNAPRLPQDSDGLNTPFRAPTDGASPRWIDHVRQPVFLAVFALLLGAIVLILLPSAGKNDRPVRPAVAAAPASPAVHAVQEMPAEAQSTVAAKPSQPDSQAPASSAVAAAVVPPTAKTGPAPATATPASAPAAVPKVSAPTAAASAAPAAAAPVATGLVVIRAKGETWIEVMDARGVAVARKTLTAGESAGASGSLPLQVTIGRVDMTDVLVRGKPFDMRRVSRDNVARFEVK